MKNTLDPRIGVLNSGVHYAFVNGYHQPEFKGTREEVERELGIRAPAPTDTPSSLHKTSEKRERSTIKKLHEYEVTVTPTVVSYAGLTLLDAYVVSVFAATNAAAISAARKQRRESEGRYAVPASYRAKRVSS